MSRSRFPVTADETPDFLALGHITLDVTAAEGAPTGRVRPGGAAAFAALTAREMGLRAAVVTSAGPDLIKPFGLHALLRDIGVRVIESPFSTVFVQSYDRSGNRRQLLAARAADLRLEDIPPAWRQAPVIFLGPLTRELPPEAPGWFPGRMIGAAVQGWLRTWDDYGLVTCVQKVPERMSPGMKLAVGSAVEFGEEGATDWLRCAEIVAHTRGRSGSRVLRNGATLDAPAFPARREVDPTGAGDIWAAACLVRLHEGASLEQAAHFASAAAGISVEREGLLGVPDRAEVEARLRGG